MQEQIWKISEEPDYWQRLDKGLKEIIEVVKENCGKAKAEQADKKDQ
jgi:hypothetical protein